MELKNQILNFIKKSTIGTNHVVSTTEVAEHIFGKNFLPKERSLVYSRLNKLERNNKINVNLPIGLGTSLRDGSNWTAEKRSLYIVAKRLYLQVSKKAGIDMLIERHKTNDNINLTYKEAEEFLEANV